MIWEHSSHGPKIKNRFGQERNTFVMSKLRKLAVAAKRGIEDPSKIKKAVRILLQEGPQELRTRVSVNVSGEADYMRVKKKGPLRSLSLR